MACGLPWTGGWCVTAGLLMPSGCSEWAEGLAARGLEAPSDGDEPALVSPPEVEGLVDRDADGAPVDQDCDDHDPTVRPGAVERLNGIDDNCDGWVDVVHVCATGEGLPDLREGLELAGDGVSVQICPGTYPAGVAVEGRSLTMLGTGGADETVLTGAGGTVLTVRGEASHQVVLRGLTLQGGEGGAGGGIACQGLALELTDLQIVGNQAYEGAGVHAEGCDLRARSVTLANNEADAAGGGLLLVGGSAVLRDLVVDSNHAIAGGGLYAIGAAPFHLETSTLFGNTAEGKGGGLWVDGDPWLEGNVFEENTAWAFGGGLWLEAASGSVLSNTFLRNFSTGDGGGAHASWSSATFAHNLFEANTTDDDGGGMRLRGSGAVVESNDFIDNVAGDDGGGIKLCHTVNELSGNLFQGNAAGDQGGGAEIDNEGTDVVDCTFVANTAEYGGGLHMHTNLEAQRVSGCTFLDNIADSCGGGAKVFNNDYPLTFRQSWFEANQAWDGGGLCVEDDEVDLANVVFLANRATSRGGAVRIRIGTGSLTNLTIHGNDGELGAGLNLEGFSGHVRNTIVSGHTGGKAVWITGSLPSGWTYNDLWNNAAGDIHGGFVDPAGRWGNLAEDPQYVDPEGGNFRLGETSPLVDVGHPLISDPDGTRSDLGAYGGVEGAW